MSTQSFQQQEQSFSQSTKEVYEGTEFGSGVLKGYKLKDDNLGGQAMVDSQQQQQQGHNFLKDTGIFGGITGDHNALAEDEVDYKRHSVKSLASHFAKVKPKAEIPVQYLPEQRIYNGDQGPSLNYLNSKSESSSSTQSIMRSTMTKQDVDASRQEYEQRKLSSQSNQQQQDNQASNISQQQANSVQMRQKTEMSEEERKMLSTRRASLKDFMLMDPATTHANAGIIDPSAILRGEPHTNNIKVSITSPSPSRKMYISKPVGPKPFGSSTLPRSYKTSSNFHNSSLAISQQMSSCSASQNKVPTAGPCDSGSLPPVSKNVLDAPPKVTPSIPSISTEHVEPSDPSPAPSKSSITAPTSSFLAPSQSEYEATVQTSSKKFDSLISSSLDTSLLPSSSDCQPPLPTDPEHTTNNTNNTLVGQPLTTTIITNTTHQQHITQSTTTTAVIDSGNRTLDYLSEADLQPAVSVPLLLPVSRSSATTPLPTTPFPPPDTATVATVSTAISSFNPLDLLSLPSAAASSALPPLDPASSSSSLPPSALSLNPPKTPNRPSSVVERRARHMSKEDIARMMAEINAPLPPMVPIPQDIRASPLIFNTPRCGGGMSSSLTTGSKI